MTGDGGPNTPRDGTAPPPDAALCSPGGGGPLELAEGASIATPGAGGLDLRCLIEGGTPPYSCEIYQGPGAGTMPAGVRVSDADDSGCLIAGGIDPELGDAPGFYGFIMVVEDSDGETVEIPVAYPSAPCTGGAIAISPPADALRRHTPGQGMTWTLEVSDIDGVDDGDVCLPCFSPSILTRAPLTISSGLACEDPGDICSDCDDCFTGSCAGTFAMSRPLELRAHEPLRDGKAGWATVDLSASYSGSSLSPCGSKRMRCHIEVLETPE